VNFQVKDSLQVFAIELTTVSSDLVTMLTSVCFI